MGATLSRYLSSLIGLLVLLGTLLPLNVLAEDSGADAASEAIALEAAQVIDEHCAAAAGGSATAAAASVAIVSDVWRRVSEELETSRKVYLLYWRGVLGQCLDQEERALADLTEFVDARRGSDLWTSLVDDAKRRIVFLRRKAGRSGELLRARRTTAAGLGIGFSAGSVALAVGAGLEWSASQSVAELIYAEPHTSQDLAVLMNEGDTHATASGVMTGFSIGIGAAAATSFILAGTLRGEVGRASVAVPVPIRGGAMLVWGRRW